MPKSLGNKIDWDEIRREFDEMKLSYIPVYVMTDDDLERCKLSDVTYGMIESDHMAKIKSWEYISVVDWEKRERLVDLNNTLGCLSGDEEERPSGFVRKPGLWIAVEEGIKARKMSAEFFNNWASLHFHHAVYLELYVGNRDEYFKQFHQTMMAIADSTIIQRHWYAHWIANAKRNGGANREDANGELVELLEEIRHAVRAPWGPYPVKWFSCLLQTEKSKLTGRTERNGLLKSTYMKLTDIELERMIEHPLITRRVLPPLTAKKFRLL